MKCLLISDTHGRHTNLSLPSADTIIMSGDYTASKYNSKSDFIDFIIWFGSLNYKNKIFISGNHEKYIYENSKSALDLIDKLNNPLPDSGLVPANITYLQDSSIVIEGIKFYGTPWTSIFYNWYFMKSENNLNKVFNEIDSDTNVLITHGPAKGILDLTHGKLNVGSESLRLRISELKELKLHTFGHIHEDRGILVKDSVTHINASLQGISLSEHFIFTV